VREERVGLPGTQGDAPRSALLGMSAPSVMEDGWWLATLWASDAHGVVEASRIAPRGGPPPGTPLAVLGPSLSGALSGLLAQAEGRQLIRLRMPPAPDDQRPWNRPLLLWVAVNWDPVRAATLRPNQLARELLRAFARAVEAAGSPG
jgi:hypothetical protein